jgi:hypothetical protein
VLRRFTPFVVVMVAVLAACQSAPAYTNPTDIITKGLEATTSLKSFHVSLALDGSFKMSQTGGKVDLSSTSLEADVDIGAKQAHLNFAVPALLGLSGDVLLIGKDLWVKTSMTGDKYSHMSSAVTGMSFEPSASLDTGSMVKEVKDFLAKDGVETKKLADVACGDRQCYQISITVPSSLMKDAGAVASLDPSAVFGDALVLNLLFDREKLWLTELSTDVASDTMGTFSVTLSFSNFDEAVTLSPPPDAQVTEGEFTIPGM